MTLQNKVLRDEQCFSAQHEKMDLSKAPWG